MGSGFKESIRPARTGNECGQSKDHYWTNESEERRDPVSLTGIHCQESKSNSNGNKTNLNRGFAMYQKSYQRSMTQLLEVLETVECQSRILVSPVCKREPNNSCFPSWIDYYNVQQEEL